MRWNVEEDRLLTERYPASGRAELSGLFPGRSYESIKSRAIKLGLRKKEGRKGLTAAGMEELKRDYHHTRTAELAIRIGCSICAVNYAAQKLGLRKDIDFIRQIGREIMSNPDHPGRSAQFKKGHTPFSKGLRQEEYMSAGGIEKTSRTRFKKGQLPARTLYDGAITERRDKNGYVHRYIRLGLRKWMPYHRYVWEQAYGKVPAGMNIQFRDNDTLNCALDNLYIIERREQVLKNSGYAGLSDMLMARYLSGAPAGKGYKERVIELMKYPKLLDLKRKQLIINQKIKEYGRKNEKA